MDEESRSSWQSAMIGSQNPRVLSPPWTSSLTGVQLRADHGYDVLVHDERLGIMVSKASLSPTPSRAIAGLWCHWVPCCFPLSLCG